MDQTRKKSSSLGSRNDFYNARGRKNTGTLNTCKQDFKSAKKTTLNMYLDPLRTILRTNLSARNKAKAVNT